MMVRGLNADRTAVASAGTGSNFKFCINMSSVVVNTSGRESGGSWFETCLGLWYRRRSPCSVAFNTLVDLNKLQSFKMRDHEAKFIISYKRVGK